VLAGGITAFAVTRGNDAADAAGAAEATTEPARSSERTTSAPRTTASSTPAGGEVPAVTGLSLSQAQRALVNAGLRVQVDETLDDTVADNTVTAQDPVEGMSVAKGSTVTLTVARRAVGVFLSTLEPVDYQGSYYVQTASLNGKSYVRAVTSQTVCGTSSSLQYDLGRHFQKFTMTAGLSDDSSSDGVLQIDVILDGRSIFSQNSTLGAPVTVDVDVSGGLRLEISASRVEQDCYYGDTVSAVWGDPEVFGAPGEVPAQTASRSASPARAVGGGSWSRRRPRR
jgi:hypothetical protein